MVELSIEQKRAVALARAKQAAAAGGPIAPSAALPDEFANLPVPGSPGLTGGTGAPVDYTPSAVPALDRVNSFANAAVDAIPVIGPTLSQWGNSVDASINNMLGFPEQTAEDRAAINQAEREQFQLESGAGSVAGTIAPLMIAPQALVGGSGTIMTRAVAGGVSGAGLTYADSMARGDDTSTAANKALMAGGVGLGFPFVAKGAGALWNGVASTLKGAVSGGVDNAASAALKSVAGEMFRASEGAGVGINKSAYDRFLGEVSNDFARLRANGVLDPKAVGVLDELAKVSAELGEGGAIQLGDLHILRQIAQKAAQSTEGRDQMLNSLVIDKLDDFMTKLTPGDIAGAADPTAAVGALQSGISNWHIAKKASLIEEALYKASNQASGYENGIRTQFRAILNNPQKRANFTSQEIAQLEQVVNGTLPANALRLVGKFGFGNGSATNALGGFLGGVAGHQLGGTAGAVAAALIGTGARQGAEAMTEAGAQSVLRSVATGQAPDTARQQIVRMLAQSNERPVNLPLSPVAAALMLQ